MQRWKPLYRLGPNRGVPRSLVRGFDKQGDGVMKIIILITTAFFAVLSIAAFLAVLSTAGLFVVLRAAAADLPRKDDPPTLVAPIGKYPVGYLQPVVTKD
jgi:hypothetical protein